MAGPKDVHVYSRRATRLTPASLKALSHTLSATWRHPTGGAPGVLRFIRWQLGTRLLGPVRVEMPWIDGTRLILERGMQGATGNLYCGLLEYTEMRFALDVLRPSDLFVDVGANVGVYTVLASGARQARTIALEPGDDAFDRLRRHVVLNSLEDRVTALKLGASHGAGAVRFRMDSDTVNRVASPHDSEQSIATVSVDSLDNILDGQIPTLIKVDVEGWEHEVLRGASQTLASNTPLALIVEVNEASKHYGFSPGDTFGLLREFGFLPYTYKVDTKRLIPGPDASANNVIFVRDVNAVVRRLRE